MSFLDTRRAAARGLARSCGALWLAVLAAAQVPAHAADWPERAIKIVVPYPPGGGTDIVARLLAKELSDRFGVGVVVDNRGGAAGSIGTAAVAHAAPDGYTLLFGSGAELTMAPVTTVALPYDPLRDLVPITQVAGGPNILLAASTFAPNTLTELVAYGKAHPGQVNYSTGGTAGSVHLLTLQFERRVGIQAVGVAYRGSGPALLALTAGEVQFTFNTPAAASELIKGGKVKAIAIAGNRRLKGFPDVPTIAESGYPGFTGGSWYGLLAPAGTPPAVVAKLQAETTRILALPGTRKVLDEIYIEPIASSSADFGRFMQAEVARYRTLMKTLNLKPE